MEYIIIIIEALRSTMEPAAVKVIDYLTCMTIIPCIVFGLYNTKILQLCTVVGVVTTELAYIIDVPCWFYHPELAYITTHTSCAGRRPEGNCVQYLTVLLE